MATLFLLFEPPRGWRHVEVTERRTNRDFARMIRRWRPAYVEADPFLIPMTR
ncbi:MAG: hypothetical protein JO252_02345 [Planctomycetaceae bacterium]|nr:hypothetical protein [Planctomycetaceae bacterium]